LYFSIFQDAEKQKQNLLNSPNQINLNKLSLSEPVELTTTNGHKQDSGDESDEETQTEQVAEPVAAAAAAAATAEAVPGEEAKSIDPDAPDSINRRRLIRLIFKYQLFVFI
jgi:hypothetical protein